MYVSKLSSIGDLGTWEMSSTAQNQQPMVQPEAWGSETSAIDDDALSHTLQADCRKIYRIVN